MELNNRQWFEVKELTKTATWQVFEEFLKEECKFADDNIRSFSSDLLQFLMREQQIGAKIALDNLSDKFKTYVDNKLSETKEQT